MARIIVEVPENCGYNCEFFMQHDDKGDYCIEFNECINNRNRCPACLAAEVKEEPNAVDDFGNPIKLSISGGQVKADPT